MFGRTICNHLELVPRNLTHTFQELRSGLLPDIAQFLKERPASASWGSTMNRGWPRMWASLFARLRHGVLELQGQDQTWANELSMTGPCNVLLLLTFELRPNVLRLLLAHARTTRMRVIPRTNHAYAPETVRFCEVPLPAILPDLVRSRNLL